MAPQTEVRGAPVQVDWSVLQGSALLGDGAGKATLSADGSNLRYTLKPDEAAAKGDERVKVFIRLLEKYYPGVELPTELRNAAGVEAFAKTNPPLDVAYTKFQQATTQSIDLPRIPIKYPLLDSAPVAPDAKASSVAAPLPPPTELIDSAKRSGDPTLGFLADRLGPLSNIFKDSPAVADYTRALADAQKTFDALNAKLKTAGSDQEKVQIGSQMDALQRGMRSLRDSVNTDSPNAEEVSARSKALSTMSAGSGQLAAQIKGALQNVPPELLPMFDNPKFLELIASEPTLLNDAVQMPPKWEALKKLAPFMPEGPLKAQLTDVIAKWEKGDVLGLGAMFASGQLNQLMAYTGQLKGGIDLMQTALKDEKVRGLLTSGLPIGSIMRGIQTGTVNTDLMGKALDGTANIAETMTLLRQMKDAAAPKPIVLNLKNPALLALAKATNLPIDPAQIDSIQIGPEDKVTINAKPGTKLNASVLGSDASIDLPTPLELDISQNNIDLVNKAVTGELGLADTLHAGFVDLQFHPTGNAGFDAFLTVLAKVFLALPMLIAALFGARAKATMKQGPNGATTELSFMGIKIGEAGQQKGPAKADGAAGIPKTQEDAAKLYGATYGDLPPSILKRHKLPELYKPIQSGKAKPEEIEALGKAIIAAKADAEKAASEPIKADIERWVTPLNGSGAHGSWAQAGGGLSFSSAKDFVPDADPTEAHWQFTQMMSEIYDFPPAQINELLAANPALQQALEKWQAEKKPGGIELELPESLVRPAGAAPAGATETVPGELRQARTGQYGESLWDADTDKTTIKPFDSDRTDKAFVSAMARMYGTSEAQIQERIKSGLLTDLKTQWMTPGSTLELPKALPGGPAAPMSNDDKTRERANDAFERGNAAYKSGDYATAEAELKAAQALAPEPETLRAIGRAQAHQGKKAEALATYDEGITLAKQKGDEALATKLQGERPQIESGELGGPPAAKGSDLLDGRKISESERAKATAPLLRALGLTVEDSDQLKTAAYVRGIQQKLGVPVDGRWGPETQKAFDAYPNKDELKAAAEKGATQAAAPKPKVRMGQTVVVSGANLPPNSSFNLSGGDITFETPTKRITRPAHKDGVNAVSASVGKQVGDSFPVTLTFPDNSTQVVQVPAK